MSNSTPPIAVFRIYSFVHLLVFPMNISYLTFFNVSSLLLKTGYFRYLVATLDTDSSFYGNFWFCLLVFFSFKIFIYLFIYLLIYLFSDSAGLVQWHQLPLPLVLFVSIFRLENAQNSPDCNL